MSKLLLLAIYAATGAAVILVCLPLALGWIGPNRWYGFHTRLTTKDPQLWYAANALAGKRLAAAGLTVILGAAGFYFVPNWEIEHYAIANLAVAGLSLAYAVLQTMREIKALVPIQKIPTFPSEDAQEQPEVAQMPSEPAGEPPSGEPPTTSP